MKILFTICGRAGSKGIKNKNIRTFLDKPLPLYTLSAIDIFLKQNNIIEYDIVVNTDSKDLERIFKFQAMRDIVFVPRKEALTGDTVGKMDVIRDCLVAMESKGNKYDMVIDMDITSPLRHKNDLQHTFEKKRNDWDVVFTVTESRRNPYFNMVVKTNGGNYNRVIESNFTARQQAPEIFDMNASIYAYDPTFLKNANNIFQGQCGIVKMQDTGVLDLDHENDFELMEVIAKHLYDKHESYYLIFDNIKY